MKGLKWKWFPLPLSLKWTQYGKGKVFSTKCLLSPLALDFIDPLFTGKNRQNMLFMIKKPDFINWIQTKGLEVQSFMYNWMSWYWWHYTYTWTYTTILNIFLYFPAVYKLYWDSYSSICLNSMNKGVNKKIKELERMITIGVICKKKILKKQPRIIKISLRIRTKILYFSFL